MLSELIKQRIVEKLGQPIRYPKDVNALAEDIYTTCKCRLSASSLRRLFGFIKGDTSPRQHSLDLIANYLGYESYDDLLETLDPESKDTAAKITELNTKNLQKGDKFELAYKPDKNVIIQYLGKSEFKVLSSRNSQLQLDDVFKVHQVSLHHPLFILQIVRKGELTGKLVEAKVSGITDIRKIDIF
jgi:hypothetical protein